MFNPLTLLKGLIRTAGFTAGGFSIGIGTIALASAASAAGGAYVSYKWFDNAEQAKQVAELKLKIEARDRAYRIASRLAAERANAIARYEEQENKANEKLAETKNDPVCVYTDSFIGLHNSIGRDKS